MNIIDKKNLVETSQQTPVISAKSRTYGSRIYSTLSNFIATQKQRHISTSQLSKAVAIALPIIVAVALAGINYYNSIQVVNPIDRLATVASSSRVDICQDEVLKKLCKDNLGIPRNKMPQVQGPVLDAYIKEQASAGVQVETSKLINAKDLTPVQNEMNGAKIHGMVRAILDKGSKLCTEGTPLLIAKDGATLRVTDGHHRYAACALTGQDITAHVVHKALANVLEDLKKFPGVFAEGL